MESKTNHTKDSFQTNQELSFLFTMLKMHDYFFFKDRWRNPGDNVCITLVLDLFMYTWVPSKHFKMSKYFPGCNSYKDSFILFWTVKFFKILITREKKIGMQKMLTIVFVMV